MKCNVVLEWKISTRLKEQGRMKPGMMAIVDY